jgi:hypothetical protein
VSLFHTYSTTHLSSYLDSLLLGINQDTNDVCKDARLNESRRRETQLEEQPKGGKADTLRVDNHTFLGRV